MGGDDCACVRALACLNVPIFSRIEEVYFNRYNGKKNPNTHRQDWLEPLTGCVSFQVFIPFFFLDSALFWAAVVYQPKAAEHIHRKHLAAQINTSAYTEMICVYMLCLYLGELGNE